MSTSHILYDITDRIGTITLNRPAVMNALGGTMREDILARLQDTAEDPAVRCVIITGAGNAFCAGGDIASMVEMQSRNDASMLKQRMTLGGKVVQFIRQMPKPVIAAINGATATLTETLVHEEQTQSRVFLSNDAREGMRAFQEKRSPQFGRRG